MESRKMVLMNLFAGQQWRNRHREWTYGHSQWGRGGGGEGEMNGESSMDACTPTFVNRQPVGICCMTQGTQTGAL